MSIATVEQFDFYGAAPAPDLLTPEVEAAPAAELPVAHVGASAISAAERFGGLRRSWRYAKAVGECSLAFFAADQLILNTASAYSQDKTCTTEITPDGTTETCTYPDGSTTTETTTTVGEPSPLTPNPNNIGGMGSRQELAQEVIDLVHAGRIRIEPLNGLHARDMRSGSTPLQNLKSAARGERSDTSARCGNAPHRRGSGEAYINTRILRFLRDLGSKTTFGITAIVGGCHKNRSNHYSGTGVDIGCSTVPFPPRKVSLADRIGRKVGIKRYRGENCADNGHTHWSTNGG